MCHKIQKKLAKSRWWQVASYYSASKSALSRSQQLFSSLHNNKGDAFRHAYWNAILSRMIGRSSAKLWTDAHENGAAGQPVRQKRMDLHNNWVGRDVAARNTYANLRTIEGVILQRRDLKWFGNGI